ncbi:MAG: DUF1501 domain-containing protein [Phycisphaeraceae bacterium]|nr:MAG: DUF1501 domain-containing protein [Phycisphaeraceae bacterium]
MDMREQMIYTRRRFLGQGLLMASAAASVPAFVGRSASAMSERLALAGLSSLPGVPDDHVLVVCQLSGGNDGLNTVIPYAWDEYYKARPGIAVPAAQAIRIPGNEVVGLHPQMTGLKSLYDEGLAAIVQGVGYPNPNRSHFKSMDIWHTADTSGTGDGWLGRYFDAECCGYGKGESGTPEAGADAGGDGMPGIAIGRTAPLAMHGRGAKPVAFESADLFRWSGEDIHESLRGPYHEANRRGREAGLREESNASFLLRTALDAQVSSETIRKAVSSRSQVQFPNSGLARELAMVAKMIGAGIKTKVYYVNHGGFDTHSGQGGAQGRHGQLLNQYAEAMKAFYAELKKQGNDARVLTMTFSEFGRRVSQNASQGTDHGTAAPMILLGPMVNPGVLTAHPSLKDLDQGDLKYNTDFRSVYAGIVEGWLKAPSKPILQGTFKPFDIVKKA